MTVAPGQTLSAESAIGSARAVGWGLRCAMSLWRGVSAVRQTGRGTGESLVRFSVARPRSLASAYRPVSRSARSTATSRRGAGSPLSRQARSRPVTAPRAGFRRLGRAG